MENMAGHKKRQSFRLRVCNSQYNLLRVVDRAEKLCYFQP